MLGSKMATGGGAKAKLGRKLLLLFRIMTLIKMLVLGVVIAACAWYYSQLDKRIDGDWQTLVVDKYNGTQSWTKIKDKLGFETKEEFAEKLRSSFMLIIVLGTLVSTTQSPPPTASGGLTHRACYTGRRA